MSRFALAERNLERATAKGLSVTPRKHRGRSCRRNKIFDHRNKSSVVDIFVAFSVLRKHLLGTVMDERLDQNEDNRYRPTSVVQVCVVQDLFCSVLALKVYERANLSLRDTFTVVFISRIYTVTVKRWLLRRIFNVFFFRFINLMKQQWLLVLCSWKEFLPRGWNLHWCFNQATQYTYVLNKFSEVYARHVLWIQENKMKAFSGACLNALFIRILKICLSIPNFILPESKIPFAFANWYTVERGEFKFFKLRTSYSLSVVEDCRLEVTLKSAPFLPLLHCLWPCPYN